MKPKLVTITILALSALFVATSHAETRRTKGHGMAGICRGDAASALAGKKQLTDRQARRMTGATIVRQIRPGQGVTMDYRRERVTIETNPKTGRIVRAFCG